MCLVLFSISKCLSFDSYVAIFKYLSFDSCVAYIPEYKKRGFTGKMCIMVKTTSVITGTFLTAVKRHHEFIEIQYY